MHSASGTLRTGNVQCTRNGFAQRMRVGDSSRPAAAARTGGASSIRRAGRPVCAAATAEHKTEAPGLNLMKWLKDNGAPQDKVELRTLEVPAAGRPLDVTVAAQPLRAGDVALSVPAQLVVTLDRIFESEGLAEMLTAGKLSELACLALYMMYEKKVGKDGFWYQYIKELDRQAARGVQAVESPLLWSDEELSDLLQVMGLAKRLLLAVKRICSTRQCVLCPDACGLLHKIVQAAPKHVGACC
eukprot:GHRQ01008282.1.p1 GENE.GHRQ01008282.1~~GHRQ01008282.1.p1  ORF type:complete len:243 (+),score=80.61 GHRQ01008282.1:315-1043(+)